MIDLVIILFGLGVLAIALWLLGATVVYLLSIGNMCDG